MKTDPEIWRMLKSKLEPATDAEGDIEEITVRFKNGGLKARTTKPFVKHPFSPSSNENEGEEESDEENTEVFIRNEKVHKIKSSVCEVIDNTIIETPVMSSLNIDKVIVKEDIMHPVITLEHLDYNIDWIMSDLSDALVETNFIDSPEELAYGCIDRCGYNEEKNVWSIDGTMYRYTDEPYKYWSAGSDTDFPTNMDEWFEFVSDSEREKEIVKNRDVRMVHFHPARYRAEESDPLVKWYKKVSKFIQDKYRINVENTKEINFVTICVDDSTVSSELRVII